MTAYLCHAGRGPLSLPCCHLVPGAALAAWALAALLGLLQAASRLAVLLCGHSCCCSPPAPVMNICRQIVSLSDYAKKLQGPLHAAQTGAYQGMSVKHDTTDMRQVRRMPMILVTHLKGIAICDCGWRLPSHGPMKLVRCICIRPGEHCTAAPPMHEIIVKAPPSSRAWNPTRYDTSGICWSYWGAAIT